MEETILMVLAGTSPSIELLSWRMEEADYSIAVDGGFLSFRQADLLPNLLIGDLDSLSETELESIKYAGFQVQQISDQHTTDFEKALNWVSQNLKTKHLIVLGGLGKRSDHMITNLLVAVLLINLSKLLLTMIVNGFDELLRFALSNFMVGKMQT